MAKSTKQDPPSTCFVIGPIGDPGTAVRKTADQILKFVVRPVIEPFGYETTRADMLGEPGLVTRQVVRRVMDDDLVIADLTGRNPNVFYELAIRHAIRKPLVQIISGAQALPFDVYDTRTIFFDISDLDSVDRAKDELRSQVQSLIDDPKPLDNPISESLDLEQYRESGDSTDTALGQILEAVADLRGDVSSLSRRVNALDQPGGIQMTSAGSFYQPVASGIGVGRVDHDA